MSRARALLGMSWAGALLPLAVLGGCFASSAATPPLLQAAAERSRMGREAYLTGRSHDAVRTLEEAVRLHLAAGDLPGGAAAMLNLALAQRAATDSEGAAATARRLRESTPAVRQQVEERGGGPEDLAGIDAAAIWLDALLALDRGDLAAAALLLAGSPPDLPETSPWPGRLQTLRAEVALEEGRPGEALAFARAGRAASAAAGDRAEEARALRFAGRAHMEMGEWPEARTDLVAALEIEEALGGGARMVGDLDQLAVVARHLGNDSEARLYAQRARLIDSAR